MPILRAATHAMGFSQKFARETRSLDALKASFAANSGDIGAALQLALAEGACDHPAPAFNATHFPRVQTTTIADVVAHAARPIKTVAVIGATGNTASLIVRGMLAAKLQSIRLLVRCFPLRSIRGDRF